MSITETTTTSWFSRIKSALAGILIGIVLVIASIIGIFWNEGHAVSVYRALDEGSSLVVSVAASPIDAGNEGKLVHVSGDVALDTMPVDDISGVEADGAVALRRKVEMFQWVEKQESKTEKKLGGGEETVTTYSYVREWSEGEIDSNSFKQAAGHENPGMPIKSDLFTVEEGKLGDFAVAGGDLAGIAKAEPVKLDDQVAASLSEQLDGANANVVAGAVVIGADAKKPEIGDLRVSYERLDLASASFVAKQVNGGLQPYTTQNGNSLFLSTAGSQDAAAMFAQARSDNAFFTWIVRLGLLLAMFIGFTMIFSIIGVIGDVVPLVGSILNFGTSFVALALTLMLGPALIAIAWFASRPLLSIVILAVGAALAAGLWFLRRKGAAPAPTASA